MGDIPCKVPSTTINVREKGDRLVCHSHLFGRNLIAKQKKSHRLRSEIYHKIMEHLDTVLVRNAKKNRILTETCTVVAPYYDDVILDCSMHILFTPWPASCTILPVSSKCTKSQENAIKVDLQGIGAVILLSRTDNLGRAEIRGNWWDLLEEPASYIVQIVNAS